MALPKTLNQLESLFLALADKTRLRILNLIGEDEICVGHLVEVLGESQPKVSRHLAYLRNAGLVTVRRDGKWMHYRIGEQENEIAVSMLEDLIAGLSDQEQMRKERRRMEEIGGITRKTVKPKKAAAARPQKKTEKVEDYIEPAADFLPLQEKVQEEAWEEAYEEELPVEPEFPPYQRQELETFLL